MAVRRRHVISDRTYEPADRWIRSYLHPSCGPGGDGREPAVVDSRSPLIVWEPRRFLPYYAFPDVDVRTDLLAPSETPPPEEPHGAGAQFYDLRGPAGTIPHAAWRWPDPQLAGYLALDWEALDHWFQEDDEVIGHLRDPYHRVDVLPTSRVIRVELDGDVLAESDRALAMPETLLPTRYYFDPSDVHVDLLTPSSLTTVCPYKGVASYWAVSPPGEARPGRELAWTYREPFPGIDPVAGRIAFLGEGLEITVDGARQPRPNTQWSAGIRPNNRGGESGHAQGAHAGADLSILS